MKNVLRIIIWAPNIVGWVTWLITNDARAFSIIVFVEMVIYLVVEIYKMTFWKNEIDTSKGLPKLLFGDSSIFKQSGVFSEESIFHSRGWKRFLAWFMLLFSVGYITFFIVYI
jgi:hypothetical protein